MVFFSSKNFALHVDRNFLRQVAVRHGRRHFRDVAHLTGQVARHEVHVVGEILPRAGDTLARPPAPPSFPSVPTSRATRVTSEANELS